MAYLTHAARTTSNEFKLDGIVVTHPDHDHIQGIQRLLKTFPPNEDATETLAKFDFHGPLLITNFFPNVDEGKKLIKTIEEYGFTSENLDENPSGADFGGGFEFHFFKAGDKTHKGVVYKKHVAVGVNRRVKRALTARNTIDTSPANISSIVTVWKDPSTMDAKAVLTGDSVGYRVLNIMKPDPAAAGKTVNVFQVPHHGSARNSLPLMENALPSPVNATLVQQVVAFKLF